MACSCDGNCSSCRRKGGTTRRKKNAGGYLTGPSHEQGGIPATLQHGGEIELEGGEYIINAQTVNAVGTEFLDELNSTATSYHQGGYNPGELPNPSNYRRGGRVKRIKKQYGGSAGNGVRTNLQTSGGEYTCLTNNYPGCGDGINGTYVGSMHYHPDKGYMAGAQHSEQSHPILQRVNNTNGRNRMRKGGTPRRQRRRYQEGGHTHLPALHHHEQYTPHHHRLAFEDATYHTHNVDTPFGTYESSETGFQLGQSGPDGFRVTHAPSETRGMTSNQYFEGEATSTEAGDHTHPGAHSHGGNTTRSRMYRRGGKLNSNRRKKMRRGGRVRTRKYQTGGHTHSVPITSIDHYHQQNPGQTNTGGMTTAWPSEQINGGAGRYMATSGFNPYPMHYDNLGGYSTGGGGDHNHPGRLGNTTRTGMNGNGPGPSTSHPPYRHGPRRANPQEMEPRPNYQMQTGGSVGGGLVYEDTGKPYGGGTSGLINQGGYYWTTESGVKTSNSRKVVHR